MAERLAGCIADTRQPERVRHSLADIIRFRLLMIACGYENGIDADSLRSDPAFKMALGRSPSVEDCCGEQTLPKNYDDRPPAQTLRPATPTSRSVPAIARLHHHRGHDPPVAQRAGGRVTSVNSQGR